jgi:hypothetical protein
MIFDRQIRIAVDYQERLRQPPSRLSNRPARSQRLRFLAVTDSQRKLPAVSEIGLDLFAQIAGQHDDLAERLARQQPQLVLQIRYARHRNHRFRHLDCERP